MKGVVVLAPAIAIHLTWVPFLERHNEKYIVVTKPEHLDNVPEDTFVLVALTMLGDLKIIQTVPQNAVTKGMLAFRRI